MAKSKDKIECNDKENDNKRIAHILGANLRKAKAMCVKMPHFSGCGGQNVIVSYERLSRLTALHPNSIRNYENGACGMIVANLVRLKNALGCDWKALLDGLDSALVEERKKQ